MPLDDVVRGWSKGRRIPLAAFVPAIKKVAGGDPLEVLRPALQDLERRGLIEVPKSVWARWPDLASVVHVVKGEVVRETRHGTGWVPAMSWVPASGSAFGLEDLKVVNDYLKSPSSDGLAVRERSLLLFGDEKRLDSLLDADGTIFAGRITLAQLGCHAVQPPLAFWRSGLAAPHLIVENHTTWAAVVTAVKAGRARYGDVIFAGGMQVTGSIGHLPAGEKLSFCDLDPAGISIASKLFHAADVRPDMRLWELLASRERLARPLARGHASLTFRDESTFGSKFIGRAKGLFARGLWIPQEAVTAADI
jgi:hypothetical protein